MIEREGALRLGWARFGCCLCWEKAVQRQGALLGFPVSAQKIVSKCLTCPFRRNSHRECEVPGPSSSLDVSSVGNLKVLISYSHAPRLPDRSHPTEPKIGCSHQFTIEIRP